MRFLPVVAVLVAAAPAASAQEQIVDIGSWKYAVSKDKITDERKVGAIAADGNKHSLLLTCDKDVKGGIGVSILSTGLIHYKTGYNKFIVRIDSEKPVTQTWVIYKNVAFPELSWDVNTILKAKRVVVRMLGNDDQTTDAEFDLLGADIVVPRLVRDCEI